MSEPSKNTTVSVKILEKEYQVACPEDQVDALKQVGFHAAEINSTLDLDERSRRLAAFRRGGRRSWMRSPAAATTRRRMPGRAWANAGRQLMGQSNRICSGQPGCLPNPAALRTCRAAGAAFSRFTPIIWYTAVIR